MKNHILDALTETSVDGRRTISTWVYSVLFLIFISASFLIVVSSPKRVDEPAREVVLSLAVPSTVRLTVTGNSLSRIEVEQNNQHVSEKETPDISTGTPDE